jgi:branched-chain amino acid transport system permease protein
MDWINIFENAARALVGLDAIIYALFAIGLNVHFGYTGLLNFGQAAFVALGAYGLGIAVQTFGYSLWVGVAAGLVGSVVLALLLGIPTLRLRADYLAIATIAAAEILRLLFRSATLRETTGGSNGRNGYNGGFHDANPFPEGTYGFGPWRYDERAAWILTAGWLLVALACVLVFLLMRSPWGRVLKGIREDEDAVRSLGKNVYAFKMQALVIGGVIGTMAGFISALGKGAVQPDNYSTEFTFYAYAVLLLGGAARVLGPVVGAMIFWAVLSLSDTLLRQAIGAGYLPFLTNTDVGQIRFIIVGAALMLLMIYRPQGIFGDKREIAINAR